MSDQIETVNPYTQNPLRSYSHWSDSEVESCLNRSKKAFSEWKDLSIEKRAELLKKASDVLLENVDKYALKASLEMGKPLKEARAEIKKCASVCDYYAEMAPKTLIDKEISHDEDKDCFVTYQPLGCVMAVMPWNFPYWQVFRFLAPTLTAGNVAVLKHASSVTGCALEIEDILKKAGFPEGVFQTMVISSSRVETLLENDFIQGVSFTGSTDIGRKIGEWAGKNLKPSVLELGGSDPYIIAPDADLKESLKLVFQSRLLNGGQSCISAKRVFVEASKKDEAVDILTELSESQKFGDPQDEETTIGPLSQKKFKDDLEKQIKEAVEAGARHLILKNPPKEMEETAYPVSLLTEISPDNPIYKDELFGPVLSLYTYNEITEAINEANATSFGLGGGVFTSDLDWGRDMAKKEIHSGTVTVNDFVKSSPERPFGGIKESGYGRELSQEGLFEFVNVKTIFVKKK